MEQAYQFASGPMFRFCFALMVLGLARKLLLFGYGRTMVMKIARDQTMVIGPALQESVRWFVPLGKASPKGAFFTLVSVLFHAGLILVPIFLEGHLLLVRRATGIFWPVLPGGMADSLTILALAAAVVLLSLRTFRPALRTISGYQDYGFPVLIFLIFASGLSASLSFDPFSYSGTMFFHAMAGNFLMAMLPFSKMSHGILFPFVRLCNLAAWKLAPGSPGRIEKKDESSLPDDDGGRAVQQ